MTVLSDVSLKAMFPWSEPGPASIDLHLGTSLLWWPEWIPRDPRTDQSDAWRYWQAEQLSDQRGPIWVLRPGYRYLIATRERIALPADCAGQVAGRSSWGRDGLAVICGPAGFVDPGFDGEIVLELAVTGSDLTIWPGAAVAQLIVHRLDAPAERPYGHPDLHSKYQGARGPAPSRFHEEWRRDAGR